MSWKFAWSFLKMFLTYSLVSRMAWARLSKLISFFWREVLLGSFVGRSNCKELASVSKNEVKRTVKWQDAALTVICPCVCAYLTWCCGDVYHWAYLHHNRLWCKVAPASHETAKISIPWIAMQVAKVKKLCWYNTAPILAPTKIIS